MNAHHALPILFSLLLAACIAEPGSSRSPSVSGESHFLTLCEVDAACADGLRCLCGVCTAPCDADAACGPVETGAVCAEAPTCAGGTRVCSRACAADADCGAADLLCRGGVCVAASVGECAAGGCAVSPLEENPWCHGDCPRLEALSQGCVGSHTEQDCTFCGETFIRVGGDDAHRLYYRPSGEIAAVQIFGTAGGADGGLGGGAAACADAWYGLDLSTCADVGEERSVPCDGMPEPPACENPPLATCFRGMTFADCGGEPTSMRRGEPTPYCVADDEGWGRRCLWFTGGCPAEGYEEACEVFAGPGGRVIETTDGRSEPACPVGDAATGWGAEPWDRGRAMNLTLELDPAVERMPPAVACGPCTVEEPGPPAGWNWAEGQCLAVSSICDRDDAPMAWTRRAPGEGDDWGLPSLVSVLLFADAEDGSLFEHWALLEMDFEGAGQEPGDGVIGQARLCFVQSTDTPTAPGIPVCAAAGRVTVNLTPGNVADVAELYGTFEATFDTFSPRPSWAPFVAGLGVLGAF